MTPETLEFDASRSSAPHPVIGVIGIGFFVWLYVFEDLLELDIIVLRPLQQLGDWWPLPLTVSAILFCAALVVLGAQARFAGPMIRMQGETLEVLRDIPRPNWGRVRVRRRDIRSVDVVGRQGSAHWIRIETTDSTIRCGLTPAGTTRQVVADEIDAWMRRGTFVDRRPGEDAAAVRGPEGDDAGDLAV